MSTALPATRSFPAVAASLMVACVMIATSAAVGLLPAVAVVGAIAVSAVIFSHPRYGLTLLVLLIFSVDWMTEELSLLPHAATWTIEGVLTVLAVRAMADRFPNRLKSSATDGLLLALLGIGLFSALAHGQGSVAIALGLRATLKYVLMYYVLLNLSLSETTWRRTIWLVVTLTLLQIPIAVYQWGVLGRTDDQVFGSLRSTGILTVVSIMVVCVLVGRYLHLRARLRDLVGVAALVVPPVIGEAKGFFLLLPPTLAVVFRHHLVRRPLRTLGAAAVLGLALAAGLRYFDRVAGNAPLLDAVRDPQALVRVALSRPRVAATEERNPWDVTIAASTWGRLESLREVSREVSRDSVTWLFGFGIGSRTFTYEQVRAATSKILYKSPTATKLYELGYLGVGVYWMLILSTWFAARPARHLDDRYWQALARVFPAMAFLFILADFYTETLNDPISFVFWFFAAALAAKADRHRYEAADLARARASAESHP